MAEGGTATPAKALTFSLMGGAGRRVGFAAKRVERRVDAPRRTPSQAAARAGWVCGCVGWG